MSCDLGFGYRENPPHYGSLNETGLYASRGWGGPALQQPKANAATRTHKIGVPEAVRFTPEPIVAQLLLLLL